VLDSKQVYVYLPRVAFSVYPTFTIRGDLTWFYDIRRSGVRSNEPIKCTLKIHRCYTPFNVIHAFDALVDDATDHVAHFGNEDLINTFLGGLSRGRELNITSV